MNNLFLSENVNIASFDQPSTINLLKKSKYLPVQCFEGVVDLRSFISEIQDLTPENRLIILDQAILLLEKVYVHKVFKEMMFGVDPIQKLRLLRDRIAEPIKDEEVDIVEFHREIVQIFNSIRDLHTNYSLPEPFSGRVAFLPFDVEEYFLNGKRRYIAARFVKGFNNRSFKKSVEIIMWNGVPIERAIAISADNFEGSNIDAERARGIETLTKRSLQRSMIPDEYWVEVGYLDLEGKYREVRHYWVVSEVFPTLDDNENNSLTEHSICLGIDYELEAFRMLKAMLYAPAVFSKKEKTSLPVSGEKSISTSFPDVINAKNINTIYGDYGYIRIFSFSIKHRKKFIQEFVDKLENLSQKGLIVDVRGNGGGDIVTAECLLQLLTPREIQPELAQFRNTSINLSICQRHRTNPTGKIDLEAWVSSMTRSVRTGEVYSKGCSITPKDLANEYGQKYFGPIVLITDSRCYSATDIFAAGFQDQHIGVILGTDNTTGAGGANVWSHKTLRNLFRNPEPPDPNNPFEKISGGASFRVSVRRTLRVGDQMGVPLEGLGVRSDVRHYTTKNDLLCANLDLLNHAGFLLSTMPKRTFKVRINNKSKFCEIETITSGVTRLDVYANEQPIISSEVTAPTHRVKVKSFKVGSTLELLGYSGDRIVAKRKYIIG